MLPIFLGNARCVFKRDIMRRMKNTAKLTSKEKKKAALKKDQSTLLSGLLLGYLIWGLDNSQSPAQGAADLRQEQEAPAAKKLDIPTEGFPFDGPENAPITIVEFSDFECPYCTKWHNEVYLNLIEMYPDQIKLVYRNFPLTNIHANAYLAAEAAMCAGDQDSYWDYHEKLFVGAHGLSESALKEYAKELELDQALFEDCLETGKYESFVRDDMTYAMSIGVQSTPTFYVNGELVIGAQPIQVFQQIIERELGS